MQEHAFGPIVAHRMLYHNALGQPYLLLIGQERTFVYIAVNYWMRKTSLQTCREVFYCSKKRHFVGQKKSLLFLFFS
jgi:hypothetical protein